MYQQIETQIQKNLKQQPYPTPCTITHIYPDDQHADIITSKYGRITYVKLLAPSTEGNNGILIFLDNDFNQRVVIPNIFNILENILEESL